MRCFCRRQNVCEKLASLTALRGRFRLTARTRPYIPVPRARSVTSIYSGRWFSTTAAKVMAIAIACCALQSHEFARAVTVSPGGSGATGILFVPDFLPTPDDVLEIEFQGVTTQGVDYDYLEAANFALLDGKIEFKQLNLFTPSIGQSFNFLEGLQVQFEFDSVSWPNAPPAVALDLNYPMNPLNGVVGVEFFAPQAVSYTGVAGSWDDLALWNPPATPILRSDVDLRNTLVGTSRTVDVDTNHAFSHAVEVSAAKTSTMTLNVEQDFNLSATHGVTIQAGGILAGSGTIVGNVSNVAGTVSPGVPLSTVPATLTIDGRYDQGSAGTLDVNLRGSTADLLSAVDDVSLAGTLELNLVGVPPAFGQQYTIVETQGSLSGFFDNHVASGLGAYYVEYFPQTAVVTMTDQFNMDQSLDHLVNAQDIDDFLLALISPDAYMDFHNNASPGTIGDWDGDGVVDIDDIPGFEAKLAANNIYVSILSLLNVPEPGSWSLLLIGLLPMSLYLQRRSCSLQFASKSDGS